MLRLSVTLSFAVHLLFIVCEPRDYEFMFEVSTTSDKPLYYHMTGTTRDETGIMKYSDGFPVENEFVNITISFSDIGDIGVLLLFYQNTDTLGFGRIIGDGTVVNCDCTLQDTDGPGTTTCAGILTLLILSLNVLFFNHANECIYIYLIPI